MTTTSPGQFDDTGKAVFNDAYSRADPRMYYDDFGKLGYRLAGEAQPHIARTVSALTQIRETEPKIIDIGTSYGINAALLNSDLTLDDLYQHYRADEISDWNREQVLERDIAFFSESADPQSGEMIGIDVSAEALRYAVDAGLLDAALAVNLEEDSLAPGEAAVLADADLVMSTGAIGYVSEKTFGQVLDASEDSRPWVANSVLRMFPYDDILEMLTERGYVTEKYESTFIQRAFASEDEQLNALDNLRELGIDPTNMEAEGHLHAEFFLSRPREEAKPAIFESLR